MLWSACALTFELRQDVLPWDGDEEEKAVEAGREMAGRLLQCAVEFTTSVLPQSYMSAAHLVVQLVAAFDEQGAGLTFTQALAKVGSGCESLVEVWADPEAARRSQEQRPVYILAALKVLECQCTIATSGRGAAVLTFCTLLGSAAFVVRSGRSSVVRLKAREGSTAVCDTLVISQSAPGVWLLSPATLCLITGVQLSQCRRVVQPVGRC